MAVVSFGKGVRVGPGGLGSGGRDGCGLECGVDWGRLTAPLVPLQTTTFAWPGPHPNSDHKNCLDQATQSHACL